MHNLLDRLMEYFPFIVMVRGAKTMVDFNWNRILEGICIAVASAVLAGGAISYVTISKVQDKIDIVIAHIDKENIERDALIQKIRMKQIEIDEYLHVYMGKFEQFETQHQQEDNRRFRSLGR